MDNNKRLIELVKQYQNNGGILTDEVLKNVTYNVDVTYFMNAFEQDCLIASTSTIVEGYKELHHHDFYEILYIKKGKYKFKVDDKTYDVNPGDMVLISPLTLHVLENVSTSECHRYVINFKEKMLTNLSSEKTNLYDIFNIINKNKNYCITFKQESKRKLENYLQTLVSLQFKEEFGDDLLYKVRFTQLLLLIYNTYMNYQHSEIIYENPLVSKVISFIQNNIDKNFIIQDIANYVDVSASSLSHIFKDVTGISIHRYISKKRLLLSKQLIKEKVKLLDVYSMCGYNDYPSFSRAFKKEYNITPKEFKDNMK